VGRPGVAAFGSGYPVGRYGCTPQVDWKHRGPKDGRLRDSGGVRLARAMGLACGNERRVCGTYRARELWRCLGGEGQGNNRHPWL
jgi:hypothetical protein